MRKTTVSLALCALLAFGAFPASADDSDPPNILVTVSVNPANSKESKVYRTIVRTSDRPSHMMAGHRVPIRTAEFETKNGNAGPITSYVYQNVGFETSVSAQVTPEGKIRISGNLHDSRVSGSTDDGQPVIEARQTTFNAMLTQGEPLRILVASDDAAGSIAYDLQAEVVD